MDKESINEIKNEIKSSLLISLHSYDKYQHILKDIPHKKYMDMVAVVKCMVIGDKGIKCFDITNDMLDCLYMTENELIKTAISNSRQRFGITFASFREFFDNKDMDVDESPEDIYFLTNSEMYYGAATLLYNGINHFIYDKLESNFYVIPANIHQLIIIPDKNMGMNISDIHNSVEMVNEFTLDEDDFLSHNYYYYDRVLDELIMQ
jgi:hypothetical protein